jgi:nitroreductase/NAD-dependent dihydropyrimidine dehydrogenase PreA subunit
MIDFRVNKDRCTRCGRCAYDCPVRIITQEGKTTPLIKPELEAQCMQCQHCLAVCPAGAISILGRNPDDSLALAPDRLPDFGQMNLLMRGRRSVRRYKDENVDPALLRRILAALANAPSGVNRRELTFTVIDDKAVMHRFREKVLSALADAAKAGRIPGHFAYLQTAVQAYHDSATDIIFRGAPHALIVSAPPDAPCPSEDVTLALAYFDLLAQSAGLGTCWWGMLKMVLETLPELKALVGLPAGHAYYAMLFGVPAIRYARTVQRDDAAAVRRMTL